MSLNEQQRVRVRLRVISDHGVVRRRTVLASSCLALAVPLWAAQAPPALEPAAKTEPVHLHVTVRGDTLIRLGQRYLVEPGAWPQIARANALRDPNRIPLGMALRIPQRLMHTELVTATVTAVVGDARTQTSGALQPGQSLVEGAKLSTGDNGSVTVRLVDGTLLRLRSQSQLQIDESRRLRDAPVVRSGVRLDKGRVEIQAEPAPGGQPGFRIGTPQGVLGVRGTEFRVTTDGSITRSEVLEGAVAVEGIGLAANVKSEGQRAEQRLAAGFGTLVDSAGRVAEPVRLLAEPELSTLPALQDRPLVRFTLPPITGATAYRAQVARDAAFDGVLADLTSVAPVLRFADLPDGDYILRVRGIDGQGLEGRNGDLKFRLKARPEPPLPNMPAPKAVIYGGRADFAWAANDEARRYRLQLALTERFEPPLREQRDTEALTLSLQDLPPATYFWRLASTRADGDMGPFGTVQTFEMRPLPPAPKAPEVGDQSIRFSWAGLPGQTFEFQLARDSNFAPLIIDQKLNEPGVELPLPGSGRFFVRLRATDADGFVGPYTSTQRFDVPNCVRTGSNACVRVQEQPLIVAP